MIIPKLNPDATRTYQIIAPLPSHFRPATCAEVECKAWANGWKTTVLPGTPEHSQVLALRGKYAFTGPVRNADGTDTFTFAAGQQCFRRSQHRKSLEREPFYRVKDGRAAPTARRADDWVDDFAGHQQMIADARTRG